MRDNKMQKGIKSLWFINSRLNFPLEKFRLFRHFRWDQFRQSSSHPSYQVCSSSSIARDYCAWDSLTNWLRDSVTGRMIINFFPVTNLNNKFGKSTDFRLIWVRNVLLCGGWWCWEDKASPDPTGNKELSRISSWGGEYYSIPRITSSSFPSYSLSTSLLFSRVGRWRINDTQGAMIKNKCLNNVPLRPRRGNGNNKLFYSQGRVKDILPKMSVSLSLQIASPQSLPCFWFCVASRQRISNMTCL